MAYDEDERPSSPDTLDFPDSDEDGSAYSSAEEEYVPKATKRTIKTKKTAKGRAQGTAGSKGKGTVINLSALQRNATSTPALGDGAEDEVEVEDDFLSTLLNGGKTVRDMSGEDLRVDHHMRPLWIDAKGNVTLEAFGPFAEQTSDFLVAIAEPVSRPALIHEYKITKHSLHAAMSVGLETNDIIEVLSRLSKIRLAPPLVERIRNWTSSYGKIKLVLKHNKYSLESSVPEFLQALLKDEVIGPCRVVQQPGTEEAGTGSQAVATFGLETTARPRRDYAIPGTEAARNPGKEKDPKEKDKDDVIGAVIGIDREDELDEDETIQSFEVYADKIETVRRRCKDIDLPALEEYDFKNDHVNPNLEIQLKPMTVIRPYQETSLSKMFGNGRARSGIIVLPCGAGKTLVGITAACTIKKSTLVLCTSAVSANQWKQQFLQFSNISEKQIVSFTSGEKEVFQGPAGIVISTYSMISKTGHRAHDAEKVMQFLRSREWGFLLLDEVHVVPADMFRKCVSGFKVHAKLGLTATLVREDEKIGDLNYLIGPKLYEANWMDLARMGHIATVQCAEVWCDMTPEFYREYLRAGHRKKEVLQSMNPNKFQATQFLIDYHERRGDKIIVFSDNIFSIEMYAKKLGKAYIDGKTAEMERMRVLSRFQHDPNTNTIFLSKVGDTSIDLPEATVLIQISSHFGSRRQEAQRLGRILRAKRRNDEGFNAFFYTLVSKDTNETYYSAKRQGFLVDQGYAFKVITELHGIEDMPNKVYPTKEEQISLLNRTLMEGTNGQKETSDNYMRLNNVKKRGAASSNTGGVQPAARFAVPMDHLSGAQQMSYVEQNKSVNKDFNREERQYKKQKAEGTQPKHSFFAKREQAVKNKQRD